MTASSGWLSANAWVLGAGTLLLGGAYQFSAIKYRCLDKCRSPFVFVMEHWSGTDHARQALGLPYSGYQPDDRPCFEVYRGTPGVGAKAGIFRCELCLPVKAL